MVLYFVYLVSSLTNIAEMTAFVAIVAFNTASWTPFVACMGLIAAAVAQSLVVPLVSGFVVSLDSLFGVGVAFGSVK